MDFCIIRFRFLVNISLDYQLKIVFYILSEILLIIMV